MSILKQILVSVFFVTFLALAWFAFIHRDLIFAGTGSSTAENGDRPGATGRSGAGTGGPTPGRPPGGAAGGRSGGGGFGGPAPVTVASVDIDSSGTDVRSIATLSAANEVTLFSEATGVVTAVEVKAGSKVAAGDKIIELESADQAVAVDKARVALAKATDARTRTEQLAKSNNAPASELADARSAEEQAVIDLRSAELDLAKRTLKAPFAGTVGLIGVAVGDLVNSQKAITSLDDLSSLTLAFDVPQRVSALVTIGTPIQATSEAIPGRNFAGSISVIDSRLDPEARTLRVEATLKNEDNVLKPGMAMALVLSFAGEPHPSVPSLSVQWDRKGSFVWKVDGEKVHRVPVQIIARHSGTVAVAGDLKEGDLVVVEGVLRLREGAAIVRADQPPAAKPAGPAPEGKPVASDGGKPAGPDGVAPVASDGKKPWNGAGKKKSDASPAEAVAADPKG